MKKLILLLILFSLVSCVQRVSPESTQQVGNFTNEFLFEIDGCKMYRFKDGGRYIYWSDCRGKIQYDYTTKSGKNNTTHHVETINN